MPAPKDAKKREEWVRRLRDSHLGRSRPNQAAAMRRYWADPDWRSQMMERRKGITKTLWQSTEYREKTIEAMWQKQRRGWSKVIDGKKRCNVCQAWLSTERFLEGAGICKDCRRGYGDYATLFALQGGVCAICGTDKPGGRGNVFHVDHDHETGTVRGLLCNSCNRALGWFGDDPERLAKAILYLRKED